MKEEDRVRKEIKWWVSSFGSEVMARVQDNKLEDLPQLTDDATDQILSTKGLRIEKDDQSLPEIPYIDELEYGDATCTDFRWGARVAQKEMRDKDNWVKVIGGK